MEAQLLNISGISMHTAIIVYFQNIRSDNNKIKVWSKIQNKGECANSVINGKVKIFVSDGWVSYANNRNLNKKCKFRKQMRKQQGNKRREVTVKKPIKINVNLFGKRLGYL